MAANKIPDRLHSSHVLRDRARDLYIDYREHTPMINIPCDYISLLKQTN